MSHVCDYYYYYYYFSTIIKITVLLFLYDHYCINIAALFSWTLLLLTAWFLFFTPLFIFLYIDLRDLLVSAHQADVINESMCKKR